MRVNRPNPEDSSPQKIFTSLSCVDEQPDFNLSSLCGEQMLACGALAAVVVNSRHECLFYLGNINRYLNIPIGSPNTDLLSLVSHGLGTKLKPALDLAIERSDPSTINNACLISGNQVGFFSLNIQRLQDAATPLLLVCFIDEHLGSPAITAESTEVIRLLEGAAAKTNARPLQASEPAPGVVLASQVQVRAANQKSIQEALYQIAAPILFLDSNLNIVFFTPAMKAIFNILPNDLGRPLADLCSKETTIHLLTEAQHALYRADIRKTLITLGSGRSFDCLIKHCQPWEDAQEAVVLVFTETTEVRRLNNVLARTHEQASFQHLSCAEHWREVDQKLRQPVQSIALIAGQLANTEFDPAASTGLLVEQLGENLQTLFDRLCTDLDLHRTQNSLLQHDATDFSIQEIFTRLAQDLVPLAVTQTINARIVPCSLHVRSHPVGLTQILSNLLFNVMTNTRHERLSLGCRRHSEWLSIELRYTGTGSREDALDMLLAADYNPDQTPLFANRSLHSAHQLSALLGLQLRVKTQPGKGTFIAICVPLAPSFIRAPISPKAPQNSQDKTCAKARSEMLLIVEPDGPLRELLSSALAAQGYQIASASNAATALECIEHSGVQPDLILTEYLLEQPMDGVQLAQTMRGQFNRAIPTIVLSANTHKQVPQLILAASCTLLRKPASLNMLVYTIGSLLRTAIQEQIELSLNPDLSPVVFLVDDDRLLRETLRAVLEANGYEVQDFGSCEGFLDSYALQRQACLIINAHMPETSALALVEQLRAEGDELPIIMISSDSPISTVVDAMKVGVCDFIEKPFRRQAVLTSVANALAMCRETESLRTRRKAAIDHIASLTARQRQIMAMVLAGQPSKNIAANLGISQRTVEKHRASIMTRTEAKSIPELARLALAAGERTPEQQ